VARTDDLTAPAAGKVKVRLVHLATGSLVAEGTIGDTINIATNLSFAGASDFREVNAGTYTITAGDPGKISSIRNLPAQALASGKIYTFLYSGSLTATGTYELNISRIDHN
ncbi:MAG TPA: hypothetical protein PL009_14565, partial [Flavipsychrobacter sp.]|nr:hypothetical protein [Flavipsychrobacter sp.]